MDVWLTWCKKKSKCKHCQEPILAGTPVVRGKLWRKGDQAKSWPMTFRWHPQCWLEQALAYLEKNPYIPPKRSPGRPRIELSEEDKVKRRRLLVYRSSLCYYQRKAAKEGNAFRVLELEVKKQELVDRIKEVGGVPKSWTDGLQEVPAE